MKFSILSIDLFEKNEVIRNVISQNNFANQIMKKIGINLSSQHVLLKDVDLLKDIGCSNRSIFTSITNKMEIREEYRTTPCSVCPLVLYKDIEDMVNVIIDDEQSMEIEFGTFFSDKSRLKINELTLLLFKYKSGTLIKTNRELPYYATEGEIKYIKVYKDIETNDEYALGKFYKKDSSEYNSSCYIDDSLDNIDLNDVENIMATKVVPIRWIVDKESGIAITKSPLFVSEGFESYENSELNRLLQSDKFIKSIGIENVEKKEAKSSRSPFNEKKSKVSLDERIRRSLLGNARIPYLVGHPGIGKTQIAKSINKNCISYNLSTFTPDSFSGKTINVPGQVITENIDGKTIMTTGVGTTHVTEPEWHKKLVELSNKCLEKNERCVLLLDEFDKLTPNMQVFINGIVDIPRTIANWEIPDNVDIIFAGNTEEYSDAAFNISGDVASRLTRIEVTPDYIDWLSWANKMDIDPIVKAFIYINPSYIIKDVKDENGDYDYSKSLTPRSWDQKISEELKASRAIGEYPLLNDYMDQRTREMFENFIDRYFEFNIEGILSGDYEFDELNPPNMMDIQFINSCLVATAVTEEEIENALRFTKKYSSTNDNELMMLFTSMWSKINSDNDSILKLRFASSKIELSGRKL